MIPVMSELLFECYQVPSVCYGIDSLFSFNFNDNPNGTALIISIGYTTTHVIPYIDGKHIADKIRRINVGGFHMITYMHRLLQLKYPIHVNNITLSRVEELLHDHCSISYDYKESLKQWALHDYYEKNVKKIQLPFSQVVAAPTLTAEQKTEKRKEMSRRLAEINARKREEKLAEDEDQLQRLEEILETYDEDEDEEDFEMALKEFNISTYEEAEKLIAVTKARIEKIKLKMLSVESGVVVEEKPIVIPQPPADKTMDEWLTDVHEKKNHILEKKQIRKQRRSDLAKRRTAAAQERMRIISKLAGKEKGTDDFGSRDEDWDVYKTISREQDSDSEVENEKLLEYDDILRHHDPNESDEPQLKMGMAEWNQVSGRLELFISILIKLSGAELILDFQQMFAVDLVPHVIGLADRKQSRRQHCCGNHSTLAVQEVEGCASLLRRQHLHVDVVLLHESDDVLGEFRRDGLVAGADHENVDLGLEHAEQTQRFLVYFLVVVDVPRHDGSRKKTEV